MILKLKAGRIRPVYVRLKISEIFIGRKNATPTSLPALRIYYAKPIAVFLTPLKKIVVRFKRIFVLKKFCAFPVISGTNVALFIKLSTVENTCFYG